MSFPIYNQDGTPFYGIVLRKATVDSVVMSLGDKITGDAYYRDNSLQVTMLEYIVYNGVKYMLVNPPTIVREGLVKDNSELKGMTRYSFEFYHPMYQLGNLPFSDVAVSSSQARYLSENKTFSWIGKPQDYIDKLNKNLEGTQWIVEKSPIFPQDKEDELSDVLTFDKNMISDALKTFYDTWEVPYVIDSVGESETSYASGKRFKVVIGYPANEIYESSQSQAPYVFRMGKGVGLKNNSRTPRNNKIVTRLSGYGSENNIPYGYPQIVWTGDEDDPRLQYPLYDGIVGGRYVKLIQHPFTRTHLMPTVYTDAVNKKVNPNATGYNPNIELVDYYDAVGSEYPNNINPLAPSYEIHEFENVKPEMNDGTSNVEILGAIPLNADLTPADAWDDRINEDGNFLQSYFQITLPQLSFDLYACAAITEEMQINMRSGACLGCTFPVQVDWDDYKRNFYDSDGNFAPDGQQRDLTKYPKSNLGSINIIVQKENSTFGTVMPNIYQQPEQGDEFVVLGISLPIEYITRAEERLDTEMKSYLLSNNLYYYDYPLKFDEHFLATHTYILSQIKPNSIIRFNFAGTTIELYVKQLTVKYGNSPLPEYDITLTDNIDVVLNQIGQVVEDIDRLGSLISVLRQSYNKNVWTELAKKLSKLDDDTAQGFIRFIQGLQVGNQFVTGLLGEGGVFRKEADGTTYLEADKMYIRIKAYFDNVEIRDYKHSAGNRIASPAGAKCCRVEYIASNGSVTTNIANAVKFRCYFRGSDGEDEVRNNFVVGDQAYCHITSVDTKDDDPNSKSLNMKHYWRLVVGRNATNVLTDNGEHWVDLSNRATETLTIDGTTYTHDGYQSSSDTPTEQDDIIQLGNIYDTDRMGAIIEFVTGADAPSYQIFQGINNFDLTGKNYIGIGYSTRTGRAYMNVYGDAYIGDKNENTYIRYEQENQQTHEPKLTIKAEVSLESTFGGQSLDQYIQEHASDWTEEEIRDLFTDDFEDIDSAIAEIQKQVDGSIETWFYDDVPSASVLPESEWKAIDQAAGNNNERLKHLGDLYYDNLTGYAYRYINEGTESRPQFTWVKLDDSSVAEALRVASEAQDTADHKRRVFVRTPITSDEYDEGDLWVNATYPANNTYTDDSNHRYYNDLLKCTQHKDAGVAFSINHWSLATKYTDDKRVDSFISQILNGTGASGNDAVVADAIRSVTGALQEKTEIIGGLVLTSLIAMRNGNKVWAGINGQYDARTESNGGAKGHGIAAWYGGGMADWEVYKTSHPSATITDTYAKSLFRFDGSGYLASGNITWDKDGIVTIANVYADISGTSVSLDGTLQALTNLSNALPLTIRSGTTYFDPAYGFTELSILGKPVATQEWASQNLITVEFFNRLFRTYNGNTLVNANDTTSTIDNIKAMFGFWTQQYISAMGQNNSGGGGGASALSDLLDVAISSPTNGQVLKYNGSTHKWYNGTDEGISSVAWGNVTDKPTTIAGYGITDALNMTVSRTANYVLSAPNGSNGAPTFRHLVSADVYTHSSTNDISNDGTEMLTSYNSAEGFGNATYGNRIYRRPVSALWAYIRTKIDGDTTLNVASATKLKTARTIWGQSFDGTGNVSGALTGVTTISASDNIIINREGTAQTYVEVHNTRCSIRLVAGSTTALNRGVYDSDTSAWLIYTGSSGNTILPIGNVGIGTTSPSYKLHVAGTFYTSGNASIGGTLGVTGATTLSSTLSVSDNITVTKSGTSATKVIAENSNGGISLYRGSNNRGVYDETLSQWLITTNGTNTWLNCGNVAIDSAANTTYKFWVNGTIGTNDDVTLYNDKGLMLRDTGGTAREAVKMTTSDNLRIGYGTRAVGNTYIYGTALYFRYGASGTSTAMYVNSSGNVGVGTTSPSYRLHVSGDIYATGAVTCLSDIREKVVLKNTDLTVEQIAGMPSVVYRWKDELKDNSEHVGSIAQTWQNVLPQVVVMSKDKEGTLSLQYGVAALVSAITTARKVVDHERRINELERENKELKEEIKQLKVA